MAVTFLFTQMKPANLLSIFLKILYVTDVIVIPPTLFYPPPSFFLVVRYKLDFNKCTCIL